MVEDDTFVSIVNADSGYYQFCITFSDLDASPEGQVEIDLEMHPVIAFEYRRGTQGTYTIPIQARLHNPNFDICIWKFALLTPDGYVYLNDATEPTHWWSKLLFEDVIKCFGVTRETRTAYTMTDFKSFINALRGGEIDSHASSLEGDEDHIRRTRLSGIRLGDRVKKKYAELVQQEIPRISQLGNLKSPVYHQTKKKRGRPPKHADYFEGL
tara:strand:+ start:255 stop:890 length:636 start_codon:yes stop_codon:yes gene_type:complete